MDVTPSLTDIPHRIADIVTTPLTVEHCGKLMEASLHAMLLPALGLLALLGLVMWVVWPRRKAVEVSCVLTRSPQGELLDLEFLPRRMAVRILNEEKDGREQP